MLKYQIIPVTAFEQNCSIVWDDQNNHAVIIDAGGEADKIKSVVESLALKVEALWLTHGHLDHAGAAGELAAFYKVPVIGPHQADKFWLDAMEMIAKQYGFPIPQPVQIDQWLTGNETLKLNDYQFEVRHTPGHTPGHVVFYQPDSELIWVGDVLFAGSIGRTDFPQGNFDHLIESIKTQLFSLPADTKFIPGHGPMSTIGHEAKTNPFLAGKAG